MVSLSSNESINSPPHPALFYQNITLNACIFTLHYRYLLINGNNLTMMGTISHSHILPPAAVISPLQPVNMPSQPFQIPISFFIIILMKKNVLLLYSSIITFWSLKMPIHDISNPGCQKTRHLENDFNLSLELCILVLIIFDGRKIAILQ